MFHPPAAFFGQAERRGGGVVERDGCRGGRCGGDRGAAWRKGRTVRSAPSHEGRIVSCSDVGMFCGGTGRLVVGGGGLASERRSVLCREEGGRALLRCGAPRCEAGVSFRGAGWVSCREAKGVPWFVGCAEKRTGERTRKVAPPSEGCCEPCGYSSLSVSA